MVIVLLAYILLLPVDPIYGPMLKPHRQKRSLLRERDSARRQKGYSINRILALSLPANCMYYSYLPSCACVFAACCNSSIIAYK
jgi:hypothetical protein